MRNLALSIVVSFFILAVQVGAVPVTFYFSGNVSNIEDTAGLLDGSIITGSMFSGSYTFESDAIPIFSAPPYDTSAAKYLSPGYVITAVVGNYSLTRGDPVEIRISNDFGSFSLDSYSIMDTGNEKIFTNGVDTFTKMGFVWTLEDWDGSVFSSLDLPSSPPDLSEFNSNQFLIRLEHSVTNDIVRIWGTMDTLVPEPTTLLLFGLGGLMLRKRRTL